jgi:Holliday junction resolvase RusA-like endonuclease
MKLPGEIKPYVRMTQRSRYSEPQAIEYIASRNRLRDDMRTLMLANRWQMIPRGVPMEVGIIIGWCRHNQDLDNIVKAVLDAANGVIYEDDCWIDSIEAARALSVDEQSGAIGLAIRPIAEGAAE